LVGALGLCAWLVGAQIAFVRSLARFDDALGVTQTVDPAHGTTDRRFEVTLSVAVDGGTPLPASVRLHRPVAVTELDVDAECHLSAGESRASATAAFRVPLAGKVTFDPPTVRVTDSLGLFSETVRRGGPVTVTAAPPGVDDLRVGRGGEAVAVTYTEHSRRWRGSGITPREVREYVAGDPASHIDWRTTARRGYPHVVEFEAETDRRLVLFVDHRRTMAAGRPGRTKLDYLREVALRIVDAAEEASDPTGLYAVGDEGLTDALEPAANARGYARIRSRLYDSSPTSNGEPTGAGSSHHAAGRAPSTSSVVRSSASGLATAARAASRLRDDDSPLARTVRPFLSARDPYVARVEDDPLFAAIRTSNRRLRGSTCSVILTDDARPARLGESVRLARRGNDRVVVFLAPSVLFEPDALADPAAAYDRYRAFDELRRTLDRLRRVDAYEVGPGERLDELRAAVAPRNGQT
jgi:uncharacterized protein (DUF58 family)